MIQISNLETYEAKDIPELLSLVEPVLTKRKKLHEKYSRGANETTLMFNVGVDKTKVPFEKFITDLATGYLAGKPKYSVSDTDNKEKQQILNKLLDKKLKDQDYKESMEIMIDYITSYNDDFTENYELIHDLLEMTACYEILYENENNEIVYSKYDPMQTVATWDYDIPANLTGIIRVWEEKGLKDTTIKKVELTDKKGSRTYSINGKTIKEEDRKNHNWGDVPGFAIETDYSIFESAEDVMSAYEQLVQNIRNTYQYNDTDAKLKIVGYSPENPMTTIDENGNVVQNQARIVEDNMLLKSKTLYISEGGDASWILKNQDANGSLSVLKAYIDLMFQLCGVPNTSDLAFNSADLNASAIDRKFYIMNMATQYIVSALKKAYLRRFELIIGRINLKKSTNYDFRDIEIEIPKNLPNNNDERIDSLLKLQNILSEQTIIEELGYNYTSEKNKKDDEATSNMMLNMERVSSLGENQIMKQYDESEDIEE